MSQQYTVKRFETNEVISQAGRIGFRCTSTTYAIVTEYGDVVVGKDLLGRPLFELYNRKSAAQQQADWYNKQREAV